jgi:hypothetical protein
MPTYSNIAPCHMSKKLVQDVPGLPNTLVHTLKYATRWCPSSLRWFKPSLTTVDCDTYEFINQLIPVCSNLYDRLCWPYHCQLVPLNDPIALLIRSASLVQISFEFVWNDGRAICSYLDDLLSYFDPLQVGWPLDDNLIHLTTIFRHFGFYHPSLVNR